MVQSEQWPQLETSGGLGPREQEIVDKARLIIGGARFGTGDELILTPRQAGSESDGENVWQQPPAHGPYDFIRDLNDEIRSELESWLSTDLADTPLHDDVASDLQSDRIRDVRDIYVVGRRGVKSIVGSGHRTTEDLERGLAAHPLFRLPWVEAPTMEDIVLLADGDLGNVTSNVLYSRTDLTNGLRTPKYDQRPNVRTFNDFAKSQLIKYEHEPPSDESEHRWMRHAAETADTFTAGFVSARTRLPSTHFTDGDVEKIQDDPIVVENDVFSKVRRLAQEIVDLTSETADQ